MSRDRAHMSAIGREGGHSRGARARAAAQGGDPNAVTDYTREVGDQSFEQQVTTERGAFESPRAASGSTRSSHGSDRGNGRDRGERSGDTPSDHRPFSGRDEI